jgi:hypothetical protein
MTMNDQPIVPLSTVTPKAPRPIKAGALATFKAVRWIAREGAKTPDLMARIKRDIVEAWKESGQ